MASFLQVWARDLEGIHMRTFAHEAQRSARYFCGYFLLLFSAKTCNSSQTSIR